MPKINGQVVGNNPDTLSNKFRVAITQSRPEWWSNIPTPNFPEVNQIPSSHEFTHHALCTHNSPSIFFKKARLVASNDRIPSPPSRLGWHDLSQATVTTFFLLIFPNHKKIPYCRGHFFSRFLGHLYTIKLWFNELLVTELIRVWFNELLVTELIRVSLRAIERLAPFQLENLAMVLIAISWRCLHLGVPLNKGTPK